MSNENTEPVRRRSHRTSSTADQAAAAKRMTSTAQHGASPAASPPGAAPGARNGTRPARKRTAGPARPGVGPAPTGPATVSVPTGEATVVIAEGSPAEGSGQTADAAQRQPVVDAVMANVTVAEAVVVDAASAELLDAKLLAHLDEVLADLPAGALATPTQPRPAPDATVDAPEAAEQGSTPQPETLWARLLADPGFASEHLARELVRRLGPVAKAWVDRNKLRYPDARPDALALLAVAEHTRTARRLALAGTLAGRLTPLVAASTDVGLLTRTQASLVLTVAAAYGADPTSADRAADLLEVLPVPRLTQRGADATRNIGRLLGAVTVRRVAGRVAPFGATMVSVVHSGSAMDTVARRAIARFRPVRAN